MFGRFENTKMSFETNRPLINLEIKKKKRIYPSLVTKQQALIHTFQNLVACFDEHSRQAQPYFKNNNNFLLKANILVRLLFFVKEKKISNEKKKENKEWIFFSITSIE